MPHVAWTLTDNSTGSPVVYSFPVNPNEFDAPKRRATVSNQLGTAPNSSVVLFQGRDEPGEGTFSGAIITEQQYNDFDTWFNKWNILTLTDDQSRTWDILVTGYETSRLNRANNNWRFDYSVSFLEV